MNHPPRIGCLIMAAGNASRFGSNKLAAKVDGKMLIEHALETVPREEFARVTVVTQYDEVLVLARRFGFTVLVNPFPEWGASHTVRFGTLGLFRADQVPPIHSILVEKEGQDMAFGAIGIGEITTIPTAPAVAGAYFALDGEMRTSLPLMKTPYERPKMPRYWW